MNRRAVLAVVLAGCGDNTTLPCFVESFEGAYGELSNHHSSKCIAVTRFAARDSPTITPTQELVDRYFDRWSRITRAEPILESRAPQKYRATSSDLFASMLTTNPAVIAAFTPAPARVDVPPTGDREFDQIMNELVRPQIEYKGLDHGRGMFFAVSSAAQFNEELLHTRLLATSSRLEDPYVAFWDDGVWTWPELGPGPGTDDATAQIDFRFGWGDCFVGCEGYHDLRAIAPASGPVTVYDMGGDPLPPHLSLSPNTLPPP